MAITSIGFQGTVTETDWARFMVAQSVVNYKHGVTFGYGVSATSTARTVRVGSGNAVVAGVMVTSDATQDLLLDIGGGSPRTDSIVLEVNWATGTAEVKVKKGSSMTAPGMIQTPGVRWEMRLADVTVPAAHTGVFTSTHIANRQPQPLHTRVFRATGWEAANYPANVNGQNLVTLNIPDPGWPFYLVAQSQIHVAAGNGRVSLGITADDNYFALGLSESFLVGEERVAPVVAGGSSEPLENGSTIVRAKVSGVGVTAGQVAVQNPGYSYLTVLQIPLP